MRILERWVNWPVRGVVQTLEKIVNKFIPIFFFLEKKNLKILVTNYVV